MDETKRAANSAVTAKKRKVDISSDEVELEKDLNQSILLRQRKQSKNRSGDSTMHATRGNQASGEGGKRSRKTVLRTKKVKTDANVEEKKRKIKERVQKFRKHLCQRMLKIRYVPRIESTGDSVS